LAARINLKFSTIVYQGNIYIMAKKYHPWVPL
jgi:hypothetical protein